MLQLSWAASGILTGQAAGRETLQDCGQHQNLLPCPPSPFPVELQTFRAKSSGQPGPMFLSWPTRETPLGLQGPKIALAFLSQPLGTADMQTIEPTSTCHRPGGGSPLCIRPNFCRVAADH